MSAEDPLAQRDRLLAELESAHAAEHEAREFIKHVEAEIERTATARVQAYTRKARGHLDDGEQLAALEAEWEDAVASLERSRQKLDAARSAVNAVNTDLKFVYAEFLSVFAQEAEASTALAAKALVEVEAPLAQAHAAWAVAQAAWRPLQVAISEAIRENDTADGIWRDHGVALAASRVPALKLPPPGFVTNHPPARPPGLRLPDQVAS